MTTNITTGTSPMYRSIHKLVPTFDDELKSVLNKQYIKKKRKI
jgi:hypothetical protein